MSTNSNKSKLIYLTPEQQEWLTNIMTNVLDDYQVAWSTEDRIVAAATLKKLHGRKGKTNDQGRFTV